jgi:hypothetical protein
MIGKEGWSIQMYQIGVAIVGTFTDCGLIGNRPGTAWRTRQPGQDGL